MNRYSPVVAFFDKRENTRNSRWFGLFLTQENKLNGFRLLIRSCWFSRQKILIPELLPISRRFIWPWKVSPEISGQILIRLIYG